MAFSRKSLKIYIFGDKMSDILIEGEVSKLREYIEKRVVCKYVDQFCSPERHFTGEHIGKLTDVSKSRIIVDCWYIPIVGLGNAVIEIKTEDGSVLYKNPYTLEELSSIFDAKRGRLRENILKRFESDPDIMARLKCMEQNIGNLTS